MKKIFESYFSYIFFQRSLQFLLLLANVIFLLYMILLGSINRLAADDYMFLARLNHYGFLGSIKWWYGHWQGRFTAHFIINSILNSDHITRNLLIYSLSLVTGYCIVLYFLILKLLRLFLPEFTPNRFLILNYSILFFNFFILINLSFSTFYWLNVSVMYFGGLLLFLIGIYGVLTSAPMLSYSLIFLGFFGAASSAEHLSAIIIVTIVALLSLAYFLSKKEKPTSIIIKKLWFALILSMTAFAIMFMAPGNDVRIQSAGTKTSILQAFSLSFKSTYIFIWQKLSNKIKYIPLLIALFLYFGSLLSHKPKDEKVGIKLSKIFLISTIILFAYYGLNFLLMGYATGNEGPERATVIICFFTTLYFAFNSIILGFYNPQLKFFFLTISLAALIIMLNINRYSLKNNYQASLIYSLDEKQRVEHLLKLKKQNESRIQILSPIRIPDENILYPNFIVDDSTYFEYCRNIHLEEGLGLPFKIMLKKDIYTKENALKGNMRGPNAMAQQH